MSVGTPNPVVESSRRSAGERSLVGYLLVPRPGDLIKGLMIVVAYVVGMLGTGDLSARSVIRAVIVIIAVELLIYAARYQWNDIRGFRADQQHPDRVTRGRLPGPLSRERSRKLASLTVAVVRMLVVVLLIVMLPGLNLGMILTCSVLGVFGTALVYEVLRGVVTGRSEEVPGTLQPAVVALWVVVGAGYAVRGLIGLALAVDLFAHPGLAVMAGVTFWAYGVAFVTSRWALEATAFARSDSGRVRWRARASQARQHQLALARWLPERLPSRSPVDPGPVAIRDWAPLAGRTAPLAPWNVAMIVAGAGAAATGYSVAGEPPSSATLVVAVLGTVLTLCVLNMTRRRPIGVGVGAFLLWIVGVTQQVSTPLLAALPWLLLMSAYVFFSTRTLTKLGQGGPVRKAVRGLADLVRHHRPASPFATEPKSVLSSPRARR